MGKLNGRIRSITQLADCDEKATPIGMETTHEFIHRTPKSVIHSTKVGASCVHCGIGTTTANLAPPLPSNLPPPSPCSVSGCGSPNFWIATPDADPTARLRCELCEPIPAPIFAYRRLFILCSWPDGYGRERPPGYEWIDWAWHLSEQLKLEPWRFGVT